MYGQTHFSQDGAKVLKQTTNSGGSFVLKPTVPITDFILVHIPAGLDDAILWGRLQTQHQI